MEVIDPTGKIPVELDAWVVLTPALIADAQVAMRPVDPVLMIFASESTSACS